VYRPSTSLYRYIDWTFKASFTGVFATFCVSYFIQCLAFGLLLMWAGSAEPECIVTSGDNYGANASSKFSDAFALSWTTFTTVGYGNTYTSTATDLGSTKAVECTWVVFLLTTEAFLGLLFAGMCAAILFGKVNRVQSHANILFCNAVCLQYEEMEDDFEDEGMDSERVMRLPPQVPKFDDENPATPQDREGALGLPSLPDSGGSIKFVDQFNGCPVLKFQLVNELCNREGTEIVDAIMKVVGIKFKGANGKVTHSQYVRVNLTDFEHPFLSRSWHGIHILDGSSPLLTDRARQKIRDNNNSWPSNWFDPDVIRTKLEFHDLIVTIAGISNVSAVTVHAYKRYMIGDVLIGYNFAPIVFRDPETGVLEVDLSMVNDVREQHGIRGENLSLRRAYAKGEGQDALSGHPQPTLQSLHSTIRIKKSKLNKSQTDLTSPHVPSNTGSSTHSTGYRPRSTVADSLRSISKADRMSNTGSSTHSSKGYRPRSTVADSLRSISKADRIKTSKSNTSLADSTSLQANFSPSTSTHSNRSGGNLPQGIAARKGGHRLDVSDATRHVSNLTIDPEAAEVDKSDLDGEVSITIDDSYTSEDGIKF